MAFLAQTPHAMKEEDKNKVIKADDMFIDVGHEQRDAWKRIGCQKQGLPVTS